MRFNLQARKKLRSDTYRARGGPQFVVAMWSAVIRGAVQYGRVGAAALVAFSAAGHSAGAGDVTSGAAHCAPSRPTKDLAPIRCVLFPESCAISLCCAWARVSPQLRCPCCQL